MKSLWLIRHAKSSWSLNDLNDSLRPLNERGYRDAMNVSARLKSSGVLPDLMVTSFAVRAYTTAVIFAKQFNYPTQQIQIVDRLYESSTADYLKTISELPDQTATVFLFGHNPIISDTVAVLSGAEGIELPTTGIAKIAFKRDTWRLCSDHSGKLEVFDYPKNGTQAER